MSSDEEKQTVWNHPWVLLMMGALFGAIFSQAVPQIWDWVQHRNDPSEADLSMAHETAVLTKLRPGGLASDLPGIIGQAPDEELPEGSYRRTVFVLQDAAILAVSDKSGRVLLVSVSAFNPQYQPTFVLPDGSKVTLWKTRVADVQSEAQNAIGFVGASKMYYYEWTWGPTRPTNFRQGFYGWSFVAGDKEDSSYLAFAPFYNTMTTVAVPEAIGDSSAHLSANWRDKWFASSEAGTFRESLVVNTVGYQAEGYDPLPVYPAPDETEVWPHILRDPASSP